MCMCLPFSGDWLHCFNRRTPFLQTHYGISKYHYGRQWRKTKSIKIFNYLHSCKTVWDSCIVHMLWGFVAQYGQSDRKWPRIHSAISSVHDCLWCHWCVHVSAVVFALACLLSERNHHLLQFFSKSGIARLFWKSVHFAKRNRLLSLSMWLPGNCVVDQLVKVRFLIWLLLLKGLPYKFRVAWERNLAVS